jgi:putative ABC transport system substrate-binding protein
MEVAHELVPAATVIGVLVKPTNPQTEAILKDLHATAQILGLQLQVLNASTERDFDVAFATLVQLRASALVLAPDVLLLSWSEQLAALAVRHAIPAIFQDRAFVAAGGLMSYGGSTPDAYRLAGMAAFSKARNPPTCPCSRSRDWS